MHRPRTEFLNSNYCIDVCAYREVTMWLWLWKSPVIFVYFAYTYIMYTSSRLGLRTYVKSGVISAPARSSSLGRTQDQIIYSIRKSVFWDFCARPRIVISYLSDTNVHTCRAAHIVMIFCCWKWFFSKNFPRCHGANVKFLYMNGVVKEK